jgi:hypothetical protein
MATHPATYVSASLQTEVDAAFLYEQIAGAETDAGVAGVFRRLAEIERGHAAKMLVQIEKQGLGTALPPPSWRARVLDRIGKMFGYDYIIGVMMDTEKSITNAIIKQKEAGNIPVTGEEGTHVQILRSLLKSKAGVSGEQLSRIEGRHKTVGGNALRGRARRQ